MEEFYTIAVPLNKIGLSEVDFGNSSSKNVKEWRITKDQRDSLLQKILYQVAADIHIPYMDYDEETNIPAKSVSEANEILKSKNTLFIQSWDIEGYNSLKEAFDFACQLNMPVYLFF